MSATALNTTALLSAVDSLSDFIESLDWDKLADDQLSKLASAAQQAADLALEACIDAGENLPEHKRLFGLSDRLFDEMVMRHEARTDSWDFQLLHELRYPAPSSVPTQCPDLGEHDQWFHDENHWESVPCCLALDKARQALANRKPMYVVTKTMIDFGGSESIVGCFESQFVACEFMVNWQGNGDVLHLSFKGEHIGYVDLGQRDPYFVALPPKPKYVSASDEDIPF